MSLTEKAMAQRTWGAFPALRTILETKKMPDYYYGASSASDSMFDHFQRILQMSILIKENRDVVQESLKRADQSHLEHLIKDLSRVQHDLRRVISICQNATEEIDQLISAQ